jgi:hypothetical protein
MRDYAGAHTPHGTACCMTTITSASGSVSYVVLLIHYYCCHWECTSGKDTRKRNTAMHIRLSGTYACQGHTPVRRCLCKARTWAPGGGHVPIGIAIIVAAICSRTKRHAPEFHHKCR